MLHDRYSIRHGGVPSARIVEKTSALHPSEQPVPPNYSVAAEQPLSINLPSIHAGGFIQQVGITKDNQMVAPSNIYMAGWFANGERPGAVGLSIIDGHVHGLYSRGIFYNLSQLKTGDAFSVTYGNHTTRTFEVVHVKTYPVAAAGPALFAHYTAIPRQLNLITCGGTYVKESKDYDGRVVVVAKLRKVE